MGITDHKYPGHQPESCYVNICTRKQALALNQQFYFTGKPCKQGHVSKRSTQWMSCHQCQLTSYKQIYNGDPARNNARSKQYKQLNRAQTASTAKQWRIDNAGRVQATIAQRRAAKLQRTPRWADTQLIREIYEDCQIISTISRMYGGEEFEVDHVVPLRGRNVSGLHVETNLQIITMTENIAKSNHWCN